MKRAPKSVAAIVVIPGLRVTFACLIAAFAIYTVGNRPESGAAKSVFDRMALRFQVDAATYGPEEAGAVIGDLFLRIGDERSDSLVH